MKKLILPLLLLVAFGMLAAVESDPSDVVGYFKKTIAPNSWQAIALPFAYSDLGVQMVMGDQSFNDGDLMLNLNTGLSTDYYSGFGWFGDLETLAYGGGYRLFRASANPLTDYYFLGKVDPQAFTVTIAGNGMWTAFGLNEARQILLDDALFGANETEGSIIIELDSGLSTDYYEGFGWFGDLENVSPTFAYNYKTTVGAPSFDWTYTPVPPAPPAPGRSEPLPSPSKVKK